ncbi:MAG: hypothetical protein ACRC62_15360 [Microcoleus sp.]
MLSDMTEQYMDSALEFLQKWCVENKMNMGQAIALYQCARIQSLEVAIAQHSEILETAIGSSLSDMEEDLRSILAEMEDGGRHET